MILARARAATKAALLGCSASRGPCAPVMPMGVMRPEGERRCLVALPTGAGAGKRPLVVMLHGAGASARQLLGMAFPPSPLSVWLEIAEREQVIVVAADAGQHGWSDCFATPERVARQDDVAFVGAIIDRMVAEHDADPQRVYLVGVSRGGLLAYRAAAEIPHRLAAFSAVLACMPPAPRVPGPTVALSALVFGATADPLMPYRGGKYFYTLGFMGAVRSIDDSARAWRELAGLADTPSVEEIAHREPGDKTRVTRFLWGEHADRLQVGLIRIEHGGHAEPSLLKRYPGFINRLVGAQNADLETAEAAWEFFKDKRAGLA